MPETEVKDGPKLLVDFKPHKAKKLPSGKESKPLAVLEVKNGDYLRKFEAKDQPFAVESEAELQMLLRTGHFVRHKETDKTDDAGKAPETSADVKDSASTAKNKAAKNKSDAVETQS